MSYLSISQRREDRMGVVFVDSMIRQDICAALSQIEL